MIFVRSWDCSWATYKDDVRIWKGEKEYAFYFGKSNWCERMIYKVLNENNACKKIDDNDIKEYVSNGGEIKREIKREIVQAMGKRIKKNI